MTVNRLREKMLYQLQGFVKKAKRDTITVDTVQKDVLGVSTDQTSKSTVYRQQVMLSCKLEDTKLKKWPDNWLDQTISELAAKLL